MFPATLELATLGTLIGLVFGVPLGVLAAVKRGSLIDQAVRIIGLIGYSMPIFWLGLLGLLVFYARLGWVEGPGRIGVAYEYTFTPITGLFLLDAAIQRDWGAFRDMFGHIILPASLLGYFSMAYISRMTRSFMLNELSQEYIVAARAKGLSETQDHLGPRAAQRRGAAGDGHRAVLCDAAGRFGADRDGVFLAGHRPLSHQFAAERRHERRARRHDHHRRRVHRPQSAVRPALPVARSEDAEMSAADVSQMSWRDWLLSERPQSRLQASLGRAYMTWRRFSANRLAVVGLAIILALVLVAILADVIAPYSPFTGDLRTMRLLPPSAEHLMGTDDLGRDIFSRVIHGSRLTLYIIILVAIIAAPIGLAMGTIAGYAGGWTDAILMRITDIFLAFPKLILALAFVAALGPGIENAIIAIAITSWPPYARIARAETLTVRNSDYIAAVQLMGASPFRIVLRHIMPLCLSSLIVRVTLDMAGIIIIAAGLGFLGLGAQPPLPEWGAMIASGRRFILDQWWVAGMPGIAILVVSLGFNLLGDGLRDALDPRSGEQ